MSQNKTRENTFFISSLLVSAGNYLFNVLMAKWLMPEVFSDVAFLVTLLLGVSFLAMTFQLTATKLIGSEVGRGSISSLANLSLVVGAISSLLFFLAAGYISRFFQFQDIWALRIYASVFVLYFLMSMNRGLWQGASKFGRLSLSYQIEMWARLALSVIAIKILDLDPIRSVAVAIIVSVILGMIPIHPFMRIRASQQIVVKAFVGFFYSTLIYEMALVLINNTDIFLVKSYFSLEDSGRYASIALIGRMIYFFAWMLVMTFIPKVMQVKDDPRASRLLLNRILAIVGAFSAVACLGSYLMSDFLVELLFGEAYLPASELLWKYSIATSLFSCANIFTYYFLAKERYAPIYFTLITAGLQIVLISAYHPTLDVVVWEQVVLMLGLLIWQLLYYYRYYRQTSLA